jgi:hypothetical protein
MKYRYLFYHWTFHHGVSNTIRIFLAFAMLLAFGVMTLEHWAMWIATGIWFIVWAAWCSRLNPAWRHSFEGVRFGWINMKRSAMLNFSNGGSIYIQREFKGTYWVVIDDGDIIENETMINACCIAEAGMKAYDFYKKNTDVFNHED